MQIQYDTVRRSRARAREEPMQRQSRAEQFRRAIPGGELPLQGDLGSAKGSEAGISHVSGHAILSFVV